MPDASPLKTYQLSNGLSPVLYDRSRHYYGGYWQVELELCCPVTVRPEDLQQHENHAELRKLLGKQLVYSQKLQRMAVRQDQLETVRHELLTSFEANALPLISHPGFVAAFIAREISKQQKKNRRYFPDFHE